MGVVFVAVARNDYIDFSVVHVFNAGSTAKILSIKVEPCPSDPCVFLRGKDTKIHFSVIAGKLAWLTAARWVSVTKKILRTPKHFLWVMTAEELLSS